MLVPKFNPETVPLLSAHTQPSLPAVDSCFVLHGDYTKCISMVQSEAIDSMVL